MSDMFVGDEVMKRRQTSCSCQLLTLSLPPSNLMQIKQYSCPPSLSSYQGCKGLRACLNISRRALVCFQCKYVGVKSFGFLTGLSNFFMASCR